MSHGATRENGAAMKSCLSKLNSVLRIIKFILYKFICVVLHSSYVTLGENQLLSPVGTAEVTFLHLYFTGNYCISWTIRRT